MDDDDDDGDEDVDGILNTSLAQAITLMTSVSDCFFRFKGETRK